MAYYDKGYVYRLKHGGVNKSTVHPRCKQVGILDTSIFLVKAKTCFRREIKGCVVVSCNGEIILPEYMIGKRIRLKVEVIGE